MNPGRRIAQREVATTLVLAASCASGAGGSARWARAMPRAPSTRTAHRPRVASSIRLRGCGPSRANRGSSWLRTNTLTESIWISPIRSRARRRCRRWTSGPTGRGLGKPLRAERHAPGPARATAVASMDPRLWSGCPDRQRSSVGDGDLDPVDDDILSGGRCGRYHALHRRRPRRAPSRSDRTGCTAVAGGRLTDRR